MDPIINEQIQLHGPMVGWQIFDLLISADDSHVTISEIIPPLRIINDHLGLSRNPLMTMLDAYLGMCWSNVKGIMRKEILKRRC